MSGRELTLTGWTLNTGKSSYDKTYALDTLTVPADGYVLVHDPDYTTDVSTLAPGALTMVAASTSATPRPAATRCSS
ncbi:MAG: hypothetical protein IPN01_24175 [Deltaproteobacteria bacterium]|nr:hypothetical protein [Deltaproteobacteria bacterium]